MTSRTDQVRVQVILPGVLAELVGGDKTLAVELSPPGTIGGLLDVLAAKHPVLVRRLRDETGAQRRYVNIYVDGADVRGEQGLETAVGDGAVIQVLPSVAGG